MDTRISHTQDGATCCAQNTKGTLVVCDADLADIIPDYLDRKRDECVQLRQLTCEEDYEEIRGIAHGMKGSGGCYGFTVITDIGAVMESAAKAGNMQVIKEQLGKLEAYLNCVEVSYEE